MSYDSNVSITVRSDVATLTFEAGLAEDRTCAAEVYSQLGQPRRGRNELHTLDNWGLGCAYLFSEQLFVHRDDIDDVIQGLEERGHFIERETFSKWPKPANVVHTATYSGVVTQIMAQLRDHPWGQIVVPHAWASGIVTVLVQAFPRENVLIVSRNNQTVRGLVRQIQRNTGRSVSSGGVVADHDQPNVHVQALSGLDRAGHDWQVLIFADVESARSDSGMRLASSMPHAAIYAVVSSAIKLDWEDHLRLRVTSGPVIHREIDAPTTNTTITVVRLSAQRLRMGAQRNPMMRKRRHIWRNDLRNQQIAQSATAFAAEDRRSLQRCGVPVESIRHHLDGLGPQPRVAIIVENVEHARSLREFLPGWRIATGAKVSTKRIHKLPIDGQRVIITLTRAKTAGVAADVIIRADGTEQGWRWAAYGPHYGLNQASMVIVDMVDTFDGRARDIGRSRIADYARYAWPVVEATTGNARRNTLTNT